jgi:hypothetical protein
VSRPLAAAESRSPPDGGRPRSVKDAPASEDPYTARCSRRTRTGRRRAISRRPRRPDPAPAAAGRPALASWRPRSSHRCPRRRAGSAPRSQSGRPPARDPRLPPRSRHSLRSGAVAGIGEAELGSTFCRQAVSQAHPGRGNAAPCTTSVARAQHRGAWGSRAGRRPQNPAHGRRDERDRLSAETARYRTAGRAECRLHPLSLRSRRRSWVSSLGRTG